MATLIARLFGKPEFTSEQQLGRCHLHQKAEELTCYLLSHTARPYPRDLLCDLLWHEQPDKQAKSYLRKALWQLNTALAESLQCALSDVLEIDEEWVSIRPNAALWVDVNDFENSYRAVQDVRGIALTAEQYQSLQSAVKLYRGDFLENWYLDWCLIEREHYREIFLAIIDKLMGYAEAHYQYEAGIQYGHQIISYDRARERAHYRLMRLKYLAGDRTGALRQFEACRQALQEELGVEPSESTLQLFAGIAQNMPLPGQTTPRPRTAAAFPPEPFIKEQSLQQALQRLEELQAKQVLLQDELKQEMILLQGMLSSKSS